MTDEFTTADWYRFWSFCTDAPNGCLLWTGRIDMGYGYFAHKGRALRAHRVSMLSEGPQPEGKPLVRHKCSNKHCVSPHHLEWGTAAENQQDRKRDGTDHYPGPKLNKEKAWSIRKIWATKVVTRSELAELAGVSVRTITKVVNGHTWRQA